MKLFSSIVFYCFATMIAIGDCDEAQLDQIRVNPIHLRSHRAERFALASNHFGLELLQIFGNENDASKQYENILFSPYSLAVTLSMVHQGADGESAKELENILRFDDLTVGLLGNRTKVAKAVQHVENAMHETTKKSSTKLDWGNMMLVSNELKVKKHFTDTIKRFFDGEVKRTDFHDGSAVVAMVNDYVTEKTNGLIKKMLEQAPDPGTRLALINTVYFKGVWANKFDKQDTTPGIFYGENGRKYRNVEFMEQTEEVPFARMPELDADLIVLPYENNDFAFVGILPRNHNADLNRLRNDLNATFIDQMMEETITRKAQIFMPRMEVETSYDLLPPLQKMGMKQLFTPEAELTKMTDEKLMIGKALHKAKLILNEEGTEAAAGTYIAAVFGLALGDEPPIFRFDHPFIYLIRHRSTGQILFIGEVHRF
uniref:Serpin SMSB3a variant n=2 Tax=Sarcoptes scabiei TaxID=52283 RepID=H9LD39_SARSC|nr:serpin SMSB3a variant [Sarcoptes scabiei]